MEALPAIQDDSSGANPSSVKSDSSSPRHDGGRGSPPPNCAICLGTCRNKSFTDSCLHQFCFKCLLTWSKVKAECPLCKQNFKSIIHNVRSNHQYEEYMVEQRHTEEVTERADVDNLRTVTRRFRYSTTFTLPRQESLAIQQLLMHYPLMAGVLPPPRRRRSPASFRRTVYRHNLWARPLPDFTGRFRDSTPQFYRYNDTQIHRLVPWLNRELSYLLNDNVGHISYVLTRIMELLPQYHITSPEFRDAMRRYFGERTEHFLHELYCFASTPYDMTGYDRNVQYTTDSRISTMVNEVISSSESEASVDSDIVMVSSSEPAEPPAGPSGVPPPAPAATSASATATDNVIPIETISHSDTDDDSSEVMVVGYIKPPQERTPEVVVDLLDSDSDVVVQEGRTDLPLPLDSADTPAEPYVKLMLKRQQSDRSNSDESDDSDTSYRPPAARRRRRPRSGGSASTATTIDTRAATPSAPPTPPTHPTPITTDAPAIRAPSTSSATPYYTSESSESTDDYSDDAADTNGRRPRVVRRKTKKRVARDQPVSRRERKRSDRRSSRNRRVEKKVVAEERVDRERRTKRKTHAAKGVKSSKRREEATVARSERPVECEVGVQAGPSGWCGRRWRERREAREERESREPREPRESRRLRSVVNVMYGTGSSGSAGASSTSGASSLASVAAPCTWLGALGALAARTCEADAAAEAETGAPRRLDDTSDSDDDLPLNLTVQKAHVVS